MTTCYLLSYNLGGSHVLGCFHEYGPWSLFVHLELSESKIDTTITQNSEFAEGCTPARLKYSVNTHRSRRPHVRATQILPGQVYHQAYLPSRLL